MGRCTFCAMHKLGDLRSADALSDREIVTAITEITHAQNRAAAQKYALLAQFGRRGLIIKSGHPSPSHYIAAGTRVSLGNATRQFATAAWLTEWHTVAEALAESDIFVEHVKEIYDGYRVIRDADPELPEDRIAAAVADLLSTAFDGTAMQVKQRVQVLAQAAAEDARKRYEQKMRKQREREEQQKRDAEQDNKENPTPQPPDKPDPPDNNATNRPPPQLVSENRVLNKLDLYLQSNGRTVIKGDVDKVLAEKLRASLSPLSRPQPAADGTRDPRSTSLRQADALSRLLDQHTGRGRTGGPGTPPSNVNVTVNLRDLLANTSTTTHSTSNSGTSSTTTQSDSRSDGKDLAGSGCGCNGNSHRAGTGGVGNSGVGSGPDGSAVPQRSTPTMGDPDWPFYLEWTGPISRSLARLLACDANLNPIIVDDNGVPLAMGMTVRLATPEQRVAVTVRDKCCIKCGLSAQWCQVHHVVFWEDGGPTDLTNLVLVCGDCHRLIHNHGWDVDFGDDGHPRLIPPAATDHERKPIRSFHRQRRPAV